MPIFIFCFFSIIIFRSIVASNRGAVERKKKKISNPNENGRKQKYANRICIHVFTLDSLCGQSVSDCGLNIERFFFSFFIRRRESAKRIEDKFMALRDSNANIRRKMNEDAVDGKEKRRKKTVCPKSAILRCWFSSCYKRKQSALFIIIISFGLHNILFAKRNYTNFNAMKLDVGFGFLI